MYRYSGSRSTCIKDSHEYRYYIHDIHDIHVYTGTCYTGNQKSCNIKHVWEKESGLVNRHASLGRKEMILFLNN